MLCELCVDIRQSQHADNIDTEWCQMRQNTKRGRPPPNRTAEQVNRCPRLHGGCGEKAVDLVSSTHAFGDPLHGRGTAIDQIATCKDAGRRGRL